MTLRMASPWEQESTSFVPAVEPSSPRGDVLVAWTLIGTSGWAALDDERLGLSLLLDLGTNNGQLRQPGPPPSQTVLAEVRRKTQLTWAQLARALGVQRRSLHFWARGERPSAANLERLIRIHGIVRAIDRGDPAATTAVLLESRGDRSSPFALLCEGRDDEVLELLRPQRAFTGASRERPRRPPPLSGEERARRRGGFSPLDRLDALHGGQMPPTGQVIATVEIPRPG